MIKLSRGLPVQQKTRTSSLKLSVPFEKDTTIIRFQTIGKIMAKPNRTEPRETYDLKVRYVWGEE